MFMIEVCWNLSTCFTPFSRPSAPCLSLTIVWSYILNTFGDALQGVPSHFCCTASRARVICREISNKSLTASARTQSAPSLWGLGVTGIHKTLSLQCVVIVVQVWLFSGGAGCAAQGLIFKLSQVSENSACQKQINYPGAVESFGAEQKLLAFCSINYCEVAPFIFYPWLWSAA